MSGVEFQSGFHRGGSAAKLVLDAQKEGKDIETSDLCVRIEALEASGAIVAAGPETAARVRRVLLDHDGREEGGGDL